MIQTKTSILAAGLLAGALLVPSMRPAIAQDTATDAPAAETVTFRVQLEKGQRFGFRQTMDMNQDIDMAGQQMSTVMQMTNDYEYEVQDVAENGDMTVKIKLGRIKGSFENPMMGALEFDSDKQAEETGNPMMDMMSSLLTANAGHVLVATLTPDGSVAKIDGIDEMVSRILENNPMAGMGGVDAESLTKSMKQTFEGQLGGMPAEPVAVGGSWTVEREFSGMQGMGINMKLVNHLRSCSADEAVIASEITGEFSGGQMAQMFTIDEFKGTSKSRISRKDGLLLESSSTMNMTASMDAGAQGQGGMTMVISTAIERISLTESTPSTETPAETPAETPGEDK